MKLYNTLTRQKEEFIPYEGNKVGFYTCGPTVYHYAHIGNMRNYIGHDILDKTLRFLGYDVKRVMNITDVGLSLNALSFITAFLGTCIERNEVHCLNAELPISTTVDGTIT